MIPAVITALIFAFVYEPEIGILNNILGAVGLENLQHAWLTNKGTALNCILFVSAWKQVGLTMVLCFAGMQGIDNSLIESARLDRGNRFPDIQEDYSAVNYGVCSVCQQSLRL